MLFNKDDLGKKVYSKKSYYTIAVEQSVMAKDKDEADEMFLNGGGIDHDKIKTDLFQDTHGVDTTYTEAFYKDSSGSTYLGTIAYDKDDYFAEEDGNVIIDNDIEEDEHQGDVDEDEIQAIGSLDEKSINDYVKEKEESDVDIAINLENESKLGK